MKTKSRKATKRSTPREVVTAAPPQIPALVPRRLLLLFVARYPALRPGLTDVATRLDAGNYQIRGLLAGSLGDPVRLSASAEGWRALSRFCMHSVIQDVNHGRLCEFSEFGQICNRVLVRTFLADDLREARELSAQATAAAASERQELESELSEVGEIANRS